MKLIRMGPLEMAQNLQAPSITQISFYGVSTKRQITEHESSRPLMDVPERQKLIWRLIN